MSNVRHRRVRTLRSSVGNVFTMIHISQYTLLLNHCFYSFTVPFVPLFRCRFESATAKRQTTKRVILHNPRQRQDRQSHSLTIPHITCLTMLQRSNLVLVTFFKRRASSLKSGAFHFGAKCIFFFKFDRPSPTGIENLS